MMLPSGRRRWWWRDWPFIERKTVRVIWHWKSSRRLNKEATAAVFGCTGAHPCCFPLLFFFCCFFGYFFIFSYAASATSSSTVRSPIWWAAWLLNKEISHQSWQHLKPTSSFHCPLSSLQCCTVWCSTTRAHFRLQQHVLFINIQWSSLHCECVFFISFLSVYKIGRLYWRQWVGTTTTTATECPPLLEPSSTLTCWLLLVD